MARAHTNIFFYKYQAFSIAPGDWRVVQKPTVLQCYATVQYDWHLQ